MRQVPMLIRSLVERMALQPQLTLEEAKTELNREVVGNSEFEARWLELSLVEQWVLREVARDGRHLFSHEYRMALASTLHQDSLSVSQIQAVIKKLLRKGLIGQAKERGEYFIDDVNFKNWLT
jgi:hypothetical protein